MKKFDELIEVANKLNAEGGCPWDLKQNFKSLRPYLLEEAHEIIEAIEEEDDNHIKEELGDLFYTIIFYAKIAEKENRFTMEEIIEVVKEKLIRRHPHVFGDIKVTKIDEVIYHWERIKKIEKNHRTSVLDGIPKSLNALARAQKMWKRMKKAGSHFIRKNTEIKSEEDLGEALFELVDKAHDMGINAENALLSTLYVKEKEFREKEMQKL